MRSLSKDWIHEESRGLNPVNPFNIRPLHTPHDDGEDVHRISVSRQLFLRQLHRRRRQRLEAITQRVEVHDQRDIRARDARVPVQRRGHEECEPREHQDRLDDHGVLDVGEVRVQGLGGGEESLEEALTGSETVREVRGRVGERRDGGVGTAEEAEFAAIDCDVGEVVGEEDVCC